MVEYVHTRLSGDHEQTRYAPSSHTSSATRIHFSNARVTALLRIPGAIFGVLAPIRICPCPDRYDKIRSVSTLAPRVLTERQFWTQKYQP